MREGKVEKKKAIAKVPPDCDKTVQLPTLKNENFSQKNDSIFLFTFFFDAAKLSCQENKF